MLAALAVPLAEAGIPVFAISTYDTDYVLVREKTSSARCTCCTPTPSAKGSRPAPRMSP